MTRDLLLSTLRATTALCVGVLLVPPVAFGQLAPHTNVPLLDHMREVNAEWRSFDGVLDNTPVAFHNDTERIAQHLRLVREHLASHTPEGLSASQATERATLLEALGTYADAGIFPQNYVLPYRNPIFIDPHGTACAVGQLMIESGHRALAERIDAAMETGYLAEIIADERFSNPVHDWASTHGFTPDELAWIQPGYPPNIPWATLGGGTNGDVRTLLTLANGDLLVAGAFTEAGGATRNRVAIWNGNSYMDLGGGLQGDVTCAVQQGNSIHVGGSLLNGMSDLATWNGSTWSYSTVMEGKLPYITALHVHDGDLYAAGDVMGFAGIDHVVKRSINGSWEQLGSPFNGPVNALSSHAGDLVAGGGFLGPVGPTDPLFAFVAIYNNGWVQLADGLDAPVHALLDVDGTLYAGGAMYANVAPTFGLARIAPAADTWERLLPGLVNYIPVDVGPTEIRALAVHEGDLYFGGMFHYYEMMVMGTNIARFTGQPDGFEILAGIMDGGVEALASHDGRLVMGGAFTMPLSHVASVDFTTGMDKPASVPALTVMPNPTIDAATIMVPPTLGANAAIRITDTAGRLVNAPAQHQGDRLRVDVSALAPGAYTIEVSGNGLVSTGRLVKQ